MADLRFTRPPVTRLAATASLCALTLLACLAAVPVAGQPIGSWHPLADDTTVSSLSVEAAEPSVFYGRLGDGAVGRLEGDDGSWQRIEVAPPPEVTFNDGSKLEISMLRSGGFWKAPNADVLLAGWSFSFRIIGEDGSVNDSGNGAQMMVSADVGATWDVLPGAGRASIDFAPSELLVFYLIEDNFSSRPTGPPAAYRYDSLSERTPLNEFDPENLFNFPLELVVDAQDSDRLYAGSSEGELWISDDAGVSWTLSPGVEDFDYLVAHPTISGIAIAASFAGPIWRTVDGGASWQELPPPPDDPFFDFEFDPIDAQRYYAIGNGTLYASDDAGLTWQPLTDGLPPGAVVSSVEIDPADPSRLFAHLSGEGNWLLDRRYPAAPCVADDTTLCLGDDGRFAVRAVWQEFGADLGHARAVPLDADDTGAFWFFDEENLELVVKVLDGRPVNDRFWVFYGALSNVEYTLVVTDTLSGETIGYHNPLERFASRGDTTAFPEDGSNESPAPGVVTEAIDSTAAGAPCLPGTTAHCLNDGRFRVEVEWEDFQGGSGDGTAVPATDDTGLFWFFRDGNLELAVKVLDGREVNGRWWVFYGALTNVAFRLTVTDTVSGAVRTYENPSGNFASRGDTTAFVGALP